MLNEFIYDPYKGGFLPPKTNAGRLFVGHQKPPRAPGVIKDEVSVGRHKWENGSVL